METKTPHPHADAIIQQLATEINTYDTVISKLTKSFNAISLDKATLFITGKTGIRKEFHEIIQTGTNGDLPVPAVLLKQFFKLYCEDLINKRLKLIMEMERLENPALQLQDQVKEIKPNILDNAEFFCPVCVKPTDHHLNQSGMIVAWSCDVCGNVNPNGEID